MKYLLSLVIIFLIVVNCLFAQTTSIQVDGKIYDNIDSSYQFTEVVQAVFYENNGQTFWNLRNEIRELDFDHCNHGFVFLLFVDTTGQLNKVQMLEGSTQNSVDSIVNLKISSIKHVIPVNYNGGNVRSLIILRLRYYAKMDESRFTSNYSADKSGFLYKKIKLIKNSYGNSKATNECEDDLYFYNEGITFYNSAKYSKAIYNFTQALEVNPADIEAKYYLGLSYQKDDNLKKACKCFSEGVQKGHENSIKAFNKYCSSVSDK